MTQIGTAIDAAVQTVKQGGLLVYPTEAVYGLGGDYRQPDVVKRILRLKQRPVEQGLILVAGHVGQILPLIQPHSGQDLATALATWPGHSTWVFPASSLVPVGIKGPNNTVAVRVSAHPVVTQLCQKFNQALISTSANERGQSTPADMQSLMNLWSNEVAYYLDLPLGGSDKPSEIRIAGGGRKLR